MRKKGKSEHKKNDLMERIGKACENIVYISETDAPVEPFFGGKIADQTADTMLEITGSKKTTQVEECDAGQFFDRVAKEKEWHTPSQKLNAWRFAELRKLLESNLHNLRLFRIGRIKIDIYIAGTDGDGNLMGIKTSAVET